MNPRITTQLVVLAGAAFVAACAKAGDESPEVASTVSTGDVATVRSAIEEQSAKFEDIIKRNDAAALAVLYTEDANLLVPNAEIATGRQAIQEAFSGMMKDMPATDLDLKTTDVQVFGETARELGTFSLTLKGPDGKTISDRGKYLVIWRRQADGSWLIADDIWNTSMPVVPPTK